MSPQQTLLNSVDWICFLAFDYKFKFKFQLISLLKKNIGLEIFNLDSDDDADNMAAAAIQGINITYFQYLDLKN